MARKIVCCEGCGRDVDITGRKKIDPTVYCARCTSPGRTHQISEEKDRTPLRSSEWFGGQTKKDNYSDNSSP